MTTLVANAKEGRSPLFNNLQASSAPYAPLNVHGTLPPHYNVNVVPRRPQRQQSTDFSESSDSGSDSGGSSSEDSYPRSRLSSGDNTPFFRPSAAPYVNSYALQQLTPPLGPHAAPEEFGFSFPGLSSVIQQQQQRGGNMGVTLLPKTYVEPDGKTHFLTEEERVPRLTPSGQVIWLSREAKNCEQLRFCV